MKNKIIKRNSMENKILKLLKLVINYSQWILLLIIFIVAFALMIYAFNIDNEQLRNILLSIASSLLASSIFASFYNFLVQNNFVNLIKASIDDEIAKNSSLESLPNKIEKSIRKEIAKNDSLESLPNKIEESIRKEITKNSSLESLPNKIEETIKNEIAKNSSLESLPNKIEESIRKEIAKNSSLESLPNEIEETIKNEIANIGLISLPKEHFSASEQPNQKFNKLIQEELKSSDKYFFKGVTGRHIAARLLAVNLSNILVCSVILLDPRKNELLGLHYDDRFHKPEKPDINQEIEKIRSEIFTSIISLFSIAKNIAKNRGFKVNFNVHHGPMFYRTEIFDDSIFVTYLDSQEPSPYPVTYVYDKKSMYYKTFMTDFRHAKDSKEGKIGGQFTMDNDTSEDDLFKMLKTLEYPGTRQTLKKSIDEQPDEFTRKFSEELKKLTSNFQAE